jgi:hypothetical protein
MVCAGRRWCDVAVPTLPSPDDAAARRSPPTVLTQALGLLRSLAVIGPPPAGAVRPGGAGHARQGVAPALALKRPRAALIAALLVAVAAPVLLVPIPFLTDYPNHLARMYILAWLDQDRLLALYYTTGWKIVPNLAVDALVPPLARLTGIDAAGKLFVLAVLGLTAGGTLALHRAIHHRRSAWPLVALLFLYNQIFLYGFLNYLFAVALALWAMVAWIRLRRATPWRRATVSTLFVLALFASHFVGIALYGLALLCYETRRWRERRPVARRLRRNLLVLVLPFVPALLLMLLSPTSGYAAETLWAFWPYKLEGLYYLVKSYSLIGDIVFAALLLAGAGWGLWTGRLRAHPLALLYAPLAALVYLVTPMELADAALVDVRLPVAFLFFLIAMTDWQPRRPGEARLFLGAIVALLALHLAVITAQWQGYGRVLADMLRSFDRIERGSRVLVAINPAGARLTDKTALQHLPALAAIERSAMVSSLFTHPGKQPLRLKREWRDIGGVDGDPLVVEDLAAVDRGDPTVRSINPVGRPQRRYWGTWRRDYDYVYILFTPAGYRPPVDRLEPLYRSDAFALFRIPHEGPG